MDNGGCDQFCENSQGSYKCSCQQPFVLGVDNSTCIGKHFGPVPCRQIIGCLHISDCGYFTGFLNMTVNILSTTRLSIQWQEPQWDVRSITRGVQVNCTDGSQFVSELHNISDFQAQLALRGTNLNVPVNCCHMVLTTEGNGPQKCEEYTPQFQQMAKGKLILYYGHLAHATVT